MSTWQVVVGVFAVLGGGAGVAAVIRVFTDRPKVRAEAAKIITDSAAASSKASADTVVSLSGRLERVEQKAEQQGKQLDDAEHMIGWLVAYVDRVSRWSRRHEIYDRAAAELARQHLVALPFAEDFPQYADPPTRPH